MLTITTKDEKDYYEITLIGEVDIYTVDYLKNAVDKEMDTGVQNIVFDFKELEYIDSTGLGALIGIRGKYQGVNIKIVNLRSNVKKLFDITGLAKIFSV